MEPESPCPQYNEDIAQLNDLASERPRMALVAGIQQENKHIMDLQQENRDLKIALEEQQNAIDLIMSKYRQHVSKLMQCQKYDQQLLKSMDTNTKVSLILNYSSTVPYSNNMSLVTPLILTVIKCLQCNFVTFLGVGRCDGENE